MKKLMLMILSVMFVGSVVAVEVCVGDCGRPRVAVSNQVARKNQSFQ